MPGYDRPYRTVGNTDGTTVTNTFENAELIPGLNNRAQRTHVFADTTPHTIIADDVDLSSSGVVFLVVSLTWI
jgi:hypothetical protein